MNIVIKGTEKIGWFLQAGGPRGNNTEVRLRNFGERIKDHALWGRASMLDE